MILELDIGNSRIKWRVIEQSRSVIAQGIATGVDDLLAETATPYTIERVRIACVREGSLLAELTDKLRQDWQGQLEIARVARRCQGVTVAYPDLGKLGVDRWLAMLAAYQDAGGAALIVDCGTALTIDLLDSGGNHQGGYIVPGLRLAPEALTGNTGIKLEGEPEWALDPGNSTEKAVYHGVLVMLVALLEKIVTAEFQHLSAASIPTLYLTGGDAELISDHLKLPDIPVKKVPELVFEGLAAALP